MRLYSESTEFSVPPVELFRKCDIDQQTFHCYWYGQLNEKHLISITSFFVFNKKHKIILWLENCDINYFYYRISEYCEIRQFEFGRFNDYNLPNTDDMISIINGGLKFRADLVRLLILYMHGGCWFDLDCLCLKSFDPLFATFKDDVCVYRWQRENYPNNAIFWSLRPKSDTVAYLIRFLLDKNMGWGFQQAKLNFCDNINLLVLPCGWFDGGWLQNPYDITFDNFFLRSDIQWDFNTFFGGCFCFHWHNRWNNAIEKGSAIDQLVTIIGHMSN